MMRGLPLETMATHLPQDVPVPHGDSAGGHDDVAAVEAGAQPLQERVGLVDGDAAVDEGNGVLRQERDQRGLGDDDLINTHPSLLRTPKTCYLIAITDATREKFGDVRRLSG